MITRTLVSVKIISHLDGVKLESIYLRPRVIPIRPRRPRSYRDNPGVLTTGSSKDLEERKKALRGINLK